MRLGSAEAPDAIFDMALMSLLSTRQAGTCSWTLILLNPENQPYDDSDRGRNFWLGLLQLRTSQ